MAFLAIAYRGWLCCPAQLPLVGGANEGTRTIYPLYLQMYEKGGPLLWEPHVFSGHPVYANACMAPLYPPTWLIASRMPPAPAYGILTLLHVALGLTGVYLLLRHWRVVPWIALVGGALYAWRFCFSSQHFAYVMCWWPWVHLYGSRLLLGPRRRLLRNLLLGALATAMMATSGHPQLIVYGLLVSTIVILVEWVTAVRFLRKHPKLMVVPSRPSWRKRWAAVGAGLLFAALLGAFQAIPAVELALRSHRMAMVSDWFATKSPLISDTHLFGGVEKIFGTWQSPMAFAWLGALLSLAWCGRRPRILVLWGLIVGCGLYALGDITPFIFLVQRLLPPLRNFRNPHQAISQLHALLIFLSALGFHHAFRHADWRASGRAFWKVAVTAGLLLGTWAACAHAQQPMLSFGKWLYGFLSRGAGFEERRAEIEHALHVVRDGCFYGGLLVLVAGTVASLLLLHRRVVRVALVPALAGAFVWAALTAPVDAVPQEKIFPENQVIRYLRPRLEGPCGPYRVLNMRVAFTRIIEHPMAARYSIRLAGGMDSLIPMHYWRSWLEAIAYDKEPYPSTKLPICGMRPDEIKDLSVLRKWNVKYIVSTEPGEREGLALKAHFRDVPTFQFPVGRRPYPHVYVYAVESEPSGMIRLLGEDHGPVPGGRVFSYCDTGERVRARIASEVPCRVVLCASDFPAWRVRVDGRPADKESFEGERPSVLVGPGRHVVEFRVWPASLVHGLWVSGVGLLAWCGAFAAAWRSERRRLAALESRAPTHPPSLGVGEAHEFDHV